MSKGKQKAGVRARNKTLKVKSRKGAKKASSSKRVRKNKQPSVVSPDNMEIDVSAKIKTQEKSNHVRLPKVKVPKRTRKQKATNEVRKSVSTVPTDSAEVMQE